MKITPAAQLFIGTPQATKSHAIKLIQKQYCHSDACGTCLSCTAITQRQYHTLIWLEPEQAYTLELLEPVFERLAFSNEPDQIFFFVLDQAERLTHACANALLKAVEEPPTGYHFLFLSQSLEAIAPTIRSRCHIFQLNTPTAQSAAYAELLALFTPANLDHLTFLSTFDKFALTEYDTFMFLNILFEHYSTQILAGDKTAQDFIPHIQRLMLKPPSPGSSKLYLRQLYLDWCTLTFANTPTR